MRKRITIFTIVLVLFILNNAFATTINIPDDYSTIQEGINAASNGDTVLVQPGTYIENINFNGKNIIVGSLFLTTGDSIYISETIIDGSQPSKPDSGSVVTFENGENNAVISGFTIKNGSNYGIYCYHCSPSITNNTITSNSDDGIYCYHYSSPTISYNTISGNSVRGIHCDSYSNPAVIENTISSNGRGIWCHYSSPTISNNIISNNSDGILCQNWSYPTISNNIILNNGNDGIWCAFSYPTINYNIISNNNSNGIYFCGCSPSITNTTISGNNTGIYCYKHWSHSCNPVIKNTIVWGNSSSFVFSGSNNPQISYTCIQGGFPSQGTNLGGNIYINPLFVGGGDYHLSWINFPIPDSTKSPCI
ncbi:MAG: right-handed parallel beta-helix repeat-containing protein, partial [Candidatus Cloacimonetes bacterium]|nr:right-handed parallel beta-helix repeat-containing protein [Candidatus Cloacimonadota bacterium]